MKSSYFEYHRYPADLNVLCFPINVMMNRAHWHSALEIVVCVKGHISIAVGDHIYPLCEGDIITIDSGFNHAFFDGESGSQQLIFEMDESWIKRSENYVFDFKTVGENGLEKNHPDVKNIIGKIIDLANVYQNTSYLPGILNSAENPISQKNRYHIISIAYSILEILQGYVGDEKNANKRYPSELLMKCIDIIQSEYATIRSQEEVAKRLGLSIPSLHRILKTQLGVSYLKYLTSVRISAAEALLMDEKNEIIDIAEQCGFSSVSSFYRDFKEYTGSSPNQYRKNRISVNSYMMNPSILARNNWETILFADISTEFIRTYSFL